MKMLLIGAILGFFIASVGLNGTVAMVEKALSTAKEYVPAAEQHLEDAKKWSVEAAK